MDKILIVGDWEFNVYEKAFFDAFKKLGCRVEKYSYGKYYFANNYLQKTLLKIDKKYLIGSATKKLNKELLNKIREFKPDLVFVYRGRHLYPSTIKKIKKETKKSTCKIFAYMNDDPFTKKRPNYFWRYFIQSIPFYDHLFAYREKNIKDFKRAGANSVSLLLPYYIKESNYQLNLKKRYDVVFIGHYENDNRDCYLLRLFQEGINLKIFGTDWQKSKIYKELVLFNGSIKPVYGREYNKVINQAKIALCFFSKINNDLYTRRNFEIAATGTLMLCEENKTIGELFEKDQEIATFKDIGECQAKIILYLKDNKKESFWRKKP